ncbi:MAG TPA: hypothetical protein IAC41_11830 [Candidatus Merdenecus merdavium]|nr:hypothetical protein [Candidatus Merdenecus merdavium]
MRKQEVVFAIVNKASTVTNIGKSTIDTPKTEFKGGTINWFDDSKLLKCNKNKEEKILL